MAKKEKRHRQGATSPIQIARSQEGVFSEPEPGSKSGERRKRRAADRRIAKMKGRLSFGITHRIVSAELHTSNRRLPERAKNN